MNDLATVREYMTSKVITLSPDTDLRRAIRVLLKHGISGAPVVDGHGALVGILSKRDCLKVAFRAGYHHCLLYTSPSPRDRTRSRMPSSA